jgi:hypothetical protein
MVTGMRIVANILRVLFMLGALFLLLLSGAAAVLNYGIGDRQAVVLACGLGGITAALLAVAATNGMGRPNRLPPEPPAVPLQPRYQTLGPPPTQGQEQTGGTGPETAR